METVKQNQKQYGWLKDYQWKPGESGNPKGRPKGRTLKTWAQEFLSELPDDKKLEFLKNLPPDIVWRMAEGNPDNSTDLTTDGQPLSILFDKTFKGRATTQKTTGDSKEQ